MSEFSNYVDKLESEARFFIGKYITNIIEEIKEGNTDIYRFIQDSKLHEWCENDFTYINLIDSANIIDQSENVEQDSGLWEGQEPMRAIETQAFYTYKGDLYSTIKDLLEDDLEKIKSENEAVLLELEEEYEELGKEERTEEGLERYEELGEKILSIEGFIQNIEYAINDL